MSNRKIPGQTPAVHPSTHTVMSLLGVKNIVRENAESLVKVEVTGIPCSSSSTNPVTVS